VRRRADATSVRSQRGGTVIVAAPHARPCEATPSLGKGPAFALVDSAFGSTASALYTSLRD
jgi:hypothetical protein